MYPVMCENICLLIKTLNMKHLQKGFNLWEIIISTCSSRSELEISVKEVVNQLIRKRASENLRLEKEKRGSYTWTFVLSARPTDERKEEEEGCGEKKRKWSRDRLLWCITSTEPPHCCSWVNTPTRRYRAPNTAALQSAAAAWDKFIINTLLDSLKTSSYGSVGTSRRNHASFSSSQFKPKHPPSIHFSFNRRNFVDPDWFLIKWRHWFILSRSVKYSRS